VTETNRARGRTGSIAAAAAYLGVSEALLRSEQRAGRSLAQIAAERGRSRAGLVAALVAVRTRRLHTALAEHAITAAEAQLALGTLHKRVVRLIEAHRTQHSG
jgi:hypothetical protein